MENKKIDFIVYEASEARHERTIKRLIIALVLSIILMFATNAVWLWAWTSYDYSSEESVVEQNADDGGDTNYIGNNGDINNGSTKNNDKAKNSQIEKSE